MGAERVDLNELEAFYSRIDFDRSPQVVAACRELRVAREVIDEADSVASFLPLEVIRKLDAYHAAIDRHDPPAGGDQAKGG
jgi:hypothetical protein